MRPNDTFLGLLTLAALAGAPHAQETPPPAAKTQPSDPRAGAEIDALIEQLGAEQNAVRRAAEQRLRELGAAARSRLEAAADGHDDPEVRWRARRVLRQLDGQEPRLAPRAPAEGRPEAGAGPERVDAETQIRRMMERFERAFGQDLRGLDDLHRQIDEMQRRIEELHGAPPLAGPGLRAEGMQIQVGPDGVRVQVEERGEDGEPVTRTYEAESVEAFRQKHPDVARRVFGPGGGIRFQPFRSGPDAPGFTDEDLPGPWRGWLRLNQEPFRPGQPLEVVPAPELAAPPAEGERLGIYVGELAPAVREFLELPPDRGLLVQSVEEGSLAAALGLRPKDVVLSIAGEPIGDALDVRRVLAGIAKGEEVLVEVNRRGEVLALRAEKAHDAPVDAEGGKLRRRAAPEREAPPVGR
jgi:hypothetical protein